MSETQTYGIRLAFPEEGCTFGYIKEAITPLERAGVPDHARVSVDLDEGVMEWTFQFEKEVEELAS